MNAEQAIACCVKHQVDVKFYKLGGEEYVSVMPNAWSIFVGKTLIEAVLNMHLDYYGKDWPEE